MEVDDVVMTRSLSALTPAAATWAIASTGVAYGFATFFARRLTDAGLAPASVAFARFGLVALVLAPCLRLGRSDRRATAWGLLSGAVMSIGWIAYVDGIEQGDVALAGVAYMTYPLFALLSLAVVFRHRLTARQIAGGVAVLAAAAIALSADADGAGLPASTLAAPATFGFSIAVLTERLGSLSPPERLSAVAVGASLALAPFVFFLPLGEVAPTETLDWAALAGLGVGAALVPMLVYSVAAPVVGAARSSVAGATELPTVFIIGALIFGEQLTAHHVVAALLIGLAIFVTPTTRGTHVLPDRDEALPLGSPGYPTSARVTPVGSPARAGQANPVS